MNERYDFISCLRVIRETKSLLGAIDRPFRYLVYEYDCSFAVSIPNSHLLRARLVPDLEAPLARFYSRVL